MKEMKYYTERQIMKLSRKNNMLFTTVRMFTTTRPVFADNENRNRVNQEIENQQNRVNQEIKEQEKQLDKCADDLNKGSDDLLVKNFAMDMQAINLIATLDELSEDASDSVKQAVQECKAEISRCSERQRHSREHDEDIDDSPYYDTRSERIHMGVRNRNMEDLGNSIQNAVQAVVDPSNTSISDEERQDVRDASEVLDRTGADVKDAVSKKDDNLSKYDSILGQINSLKSVANDPVSNNDPVSGNDPGSGNGSGSAGGSENTGSAPAPADSGSPLDYVVGLLDTDMPDYTGGDD